jgi:putative transposase
MELRHKYDLAILLNCLHMARSSFYYYVKQLGNADKYIEVKALIQSLYHKHKGRLGYRRITLLLRQQGQIINHKTVFPPPWVLRFVLRRRLVSRQAANRAKPVLPHY